MDVWHWTSLVALLCYAGLRAIPDAVLPGRADRPALRAWAVFRHIQLPKLKSVLLIAVLLRFMDSFMIYTEPFVVTGGGPGNATTFVRSTLTQDRARPIRSRSGSGVVAGLLPHHPDGVLGVLHRDDQLTRTSDANR
jgi:ABC-type sugar transport system permease subunit